MKKRTKNLLDAARAAENWLAEFAFQSPDSGLHDLLIDLRLALSDFGVLTTPIQRCEVQGCKAAAEWEGWWRARDPLTGEPTGLIQRRAVCDEHRWLLIQEGGGPR